MCIKQAYQLSLSGTQFGNGGLETALGSEQILGRHLVPVLRHEQAALRQQQAAQFGLHFTANSSPFTFTGLIRQLARLLGSR
jgi:hypothetical protein